LEELVPKVKESTGLRDQPDLAAEEALVSERRSGRWQWREREGRGWKRGVHPDAPFLYGQTAGPDITDQVWTGYSSPWIIRLEVARIIRPGASLLRKTG
jgi:hypothetical protein